MDPSDGKLKEKLSILLPSLNEKQIRLLVAAEAISFGYGGIKLLSSITGISENTISRGVREIKHGDEDSCVRAKGLSQNNLRFFRASFYGF